MKILVASKNPVKVNAAKEAFTQAFPNKTFDVEGVNVPSGVSDQPMSEDETRSGARNRVQALQDLEPEADFYVGIEGGIEEKDGKLHTIAVIHIEDKHGRSGEALSASFELPEQIVQMVRSGIELGDASAQFFDHENSKQKNGVIGLLTQDLITRTDYYVHPAILALVPFTNPHLY